MKTNVQRSKGLERGGEKDGNNRYCLKMPHKMEMYFEDKHGS